MGDISLVYVAWLVNVLKREGSHITDYKTGKNNRNYSTVISQWSRQSDFLTHAWQTEWNFRQGFVTSCLIYLHVKRCLLQRYVKVNSSLCWIQRHIIKACVGVVVLLQALKPLYKVVQIWPELFVCKQVTVCPGHIWTTFVLDGDKQSSLRKRSCAPRKIHPVPFEQESGCYWMVIWAHWRREKLDFLAGNRTPFPRFCSMCRLSYCKIFVLIFYFISLVAVMYRCISVF
jgi:hypothetical protein